MVLKVILYPKYLMVKLNCYEYIINWKKKIMTRGGGVLMAIEHIIKASSHQIGSSSSSL